MRLKLSQPSLCDEEYPPLDGDFQNRTYGSRLHLEEVRGFWKKTLRLIRTGKAPSGAGLYVHWPFCAQRCAYCYCDTRVAKERDEPEEYLAAILSEMKSFRDLFDGVALTSFILAGGTPTHASAGQLTRLFDAVGETFRFEPGADIAVEATPSTLTGEIAALLARKGVSRIDMGVDSLDPAVLQKAGRRQDRSAVERACRAVRTAGMSLDVGLMCGLEGQTPDSFLRDIASVLALEPSQVRLYEFDPRPQTLFAQAGKTARGGDLEAAERVMRDAGYAAPESTWAVPPSYLGIGASAKSRCFGAGWYHHQPGNRTGYYGMPMSLSEEKRGRLIGRLSTVGRLPREEFTGTFGAETLKELEQDGSLAVGEGDVRLRPGGARALRRIYGNGVRRELRRAYGKAWEDAAARPAGAACRVYAAMKKKLDVPLYEYLSTFCFDDYYFPMDGDFQNFTYFPRSDLEEVRASWKVTASLMRAGQAPPDIGLYLHWPYCISKCTFCFCSMTVPRSGKETRMQLDALHAELDAFYDIFNGIRFSSFWMGGGTPTFMSAADLDSLLGHVRRRYAFTPDAQFYLESSPATLTREKADVLASHGVNRITLGVQSLDGRVLAAVNRKKQDRAAVERSFKLARERGMMIDMDLMFGLEGQSRVSFVRDLVWALKKKPDVLHIFAFDPKPQTSHARNADPKALQVLMDIADKLVRGAGYRMSRLDPVTLKPDCPEEKQDSAVRREGASVLGIGMSAVSHAYGSAWYCHPLMEGAGKPTGEIPPFRLMRSNVSEEMRGHALRNLALYGRVSKKAMAEVPGLRDLAQSGHLRVENGEGVYAGRDPVEKNVMLKHLYSPELIRAVMRGREFPQGRRNRDAIRAKMDARNLFRVYFKQP